MRPRCWRLARGNRAVRSPSSAAGICTARPPHAHCTPTACAGVARLLRLWAGLHGPHGLRAQLLYAEAAGQGVELGDFDDDIGGAGGNGNGGNDGGSFEDGGREGAGGGEALLRRLGAAEAAAEAEEAVTHNAAALVVRLLRGAQLRAAVADAAEAAWAAGAAEVAEAAAATRTSRAGAAPAVGGIAGVVAARRVSEDELAEQTHRADSAMVDTLQIAIWAELGASHCGARFGDLLRGGGEGEGVSRGDEAAAGDDEAAGEAAGEAEAAREVGESAELLARIWLLAHGGMARPRVEVCTARPASPAPHAPRPACTPRPACIPHHLHLRARV